LTERLTLGATRSWRGDDDGGRLVASGVYLYLLQTEQETRTRKMVVVR
jgi:hypothetical protein